MELAEIIIYGGINHWIDIAYRKNPYTKWFIIIQTTNGTSYPEYWEDLEVKIQELNKIQQNFPEGEQIKYSILNVNFSSDLVNSIRYFTKLIRKISDKKFSISCNLTTGVFELRIALFLAAQIEIKKVKDIFYYNKQTLKKNFVFKNFLISKRGKLALQLLYKKFKETNNKFIEEFEVSLTMLNKIFEENKIYLDLPTLSRLVNDLIKDNFLDYRREGREKLIRFSNKGLLFCPFDEFNFRI